MKTVIDASVALKWQFEEEEASGPATLLLKDTGDRKLFQAPEIHLPWVKWIGNY